ncbi:MAG: hypothetical protein ACYDBJ_24730 [Aggregatilineales bacterium]
MNRRVEFTLNLDDPLENAIYEALAVALHRRRAGELIRQALTAFLFNNDAPATGGNCRSMPPTTPKTQSKPTGAEIDAHSTEQILDQSAAMFGF